MTYRKPSGEAVGGREQLPRAAIDPREGKGGDASSGDLGTLVVLLVSASRGPVALEGGA